MISLGLLMKIRKTFILLVLINFPLGIVFSQNVNHDTLAADFFRQFEKSHSGNKDSMNLMVNRLIQQVTAEYPGKAGLVLCSAGILLDDHDYDDAAMKSLRASLPLISKKKNPKEYINCALAMADVFYKAMKADSASHYVDLGYRVSQEELISQYDDDIYNDRARIANLSGQRLLAIDWYLKAADIQRQRKDSVGLGIVLGNIGALHINLKNYDEALKYLHESEMYNEHQKNEAALNDTYSNLAVAYNEHGKLSESIMYYYKSIFLSKKLKNDFQLARAFMNLASAFITEKKYAEAEAYLDSSNVICENNNIQFGLLLYKINQGQLILETGQISKGLALLEDAEQDMASYDMPGIQSELWEIISTGYEKDKQYQRALDYYKKFVALKDSIGGSETNRYVFELQTRYESEHSARQIEQLQKNIEKQKARNGYIVMGLGMLVIIILLIGVLLIIYRRAQQYKHRLAQEENEKLRLSIDIKDQELVSKAMNMAKINQMVLDVSEQLKKVSPGLTKEKTESLQQLLKNLESSLPTEAWKEFETRFEQVHKGFYDKLLTLYPDLSPAELKVCGFLRLNLTTKDIALLANRSSGTIDHSRSSIRSKMNLENDANLTTFLLSL